MSREDLQEKLGYSDKWFDYGFLDLEALVEQELRFETGNDHNTEHFRFGAFRSVLKSRTSLSSEDVDHYIELALEDPDQQMGLSARNMAAAKLRVGRARLQGAAGRRPQ